LKRKIKFILTVGFAIVLLLSACTAQPQAHFDSIDTLIAEGIIAPFDPDQLQPLDFNLVKVERGDIVSNLDLGVSIEFPRTYHLHFEVETISGHNSSMTQTAWDYGRFSGLFVGPNAVVTEGDLIAELTFGVPETIAIARRALELERNQFENSFALERQNRRQEIADLRVELEIAPEGEWEITALRLERAELAYRQFTNNAENRREQFDDRLERINAPIETERLYAPVSGVVSRTTQHFGPGYFRDLIPVTGGGMGNLGRSPASIIDMEYKHFILEAPLYVLRYGEIIPVFRQGGEAFFYAQIATDPLTENIVREGVHSARLIPLEGEFERFMEEVAEELGDNFNPENPYGLLTLRTRITIVRGNNVVYLDRRAIMEDNQRHFVLVYEDGAVGRRYISTGPNAFADSIAVTQILAGLTPGQWVVIP